MVFLLQICSPSPDTAWLQSIWGSVSKQANFVIKISSHTPISVSTSLRTNVSDKSCAIENVRHLELCHLFQRLSLLMKGNAALLVNRVPEDDSVDPAVNGIE